MVRDAFRRALRGGDTPPDTDPLPADRLADGGFDLDLSAQLALLQELRADDHQGLFQRLRADDRINIGFGGVDYRERELIHNGYFPTPDAELYAAMIVRHRPSRIIEVGSGYSTVIARSAIEHAGLDCEIHVIDPEPRRDVERVADRIDYPAVYREWAYAEQYLL